MDGADWASVAESHVGFGERGRGRQSRETVGCGFPERMICGKRNWQTKTTGRWRPQQNVEERNVGTIVSLSAPAILLVFLDRY